MNVLYVLPDVHDPPAGGPELTRNEILRYMAPRHDCEVAVLNTRETGSTRDFLDEIGATLRTEVTYPCRYRRLLVDLAATTKLGRPLTRPLDDRLLRFVARVEELVETHDYDVVHLDNPVLAPLASTLNSAILVYFLMDAPTLRYRTLASHASDVSSKGFYLLASLAGRYIETAAARHSTVLGMAADEEARRLAERFPEAEIRASGLPIPRRFFREREGSSRPADESTRVLFLGDLETFYIRKGLSGFLTEAWPQLRNEHPDLELFVLGRGAGAYLKDEPDDLTENVHWESWVDDYVGALSRADIVLVPDPAGSGQKNRVLQSLALGLPVVGSPEAWRGIPVEDGVQGFVARTPPEFASCISKLVTTPSLRTALGSRAREMVHNRFRTEAVGEAWESIYREAQRREDGDGTPAPRVERPEHAEH